MKTKFFIIVSLVVCVAIYLMFLATQTGTASVLLVEELLKRGDASRIRVAGRVASKKIHYQVEPTFRLSFTIEDRPNEEPSLKQESTSQTYTGKTNEEAQSYLQIPVVYEGVKPDMFTEGRDVIIDGDFRGGVLYASSLLTQCPSKYEAPKPGESAGARSHPSSIPIPDEKGDS